MEEPIANTSLYETDIYAWSEQQAKVLRGLEARRDLPNDLDLSNVIEEIEDAGRWELTTTKILFGRIFTALIMAWADPTNGSARDWTVEAIDWLSEARARLTASMGCNLGLPQLWRDAVQLAGTKLEILGHDDALKHVALLSADECPWRLEDLSVRSVTVLDLVRHLSGQIASDAA